MDNWQPIETAPKDGTSILAYDPQHYSGAPDPHLMWVVAWDGDNWTENGGECYLVMYPTHWQPLPEPPK